VNNLRCLVKHGTCDYRVSKSLVISFEKLDSGRKRIAVEDPSPVNIQDPPAINVEDSSGAEEKCVADSKVICLTALSDKTSVFLQNTRKRSFLEIMRHLLSATSWTIPVTSIGHGAKSTRTGGTTMGKRTP